ncbi:MAG TPA: hypothetical protein VFR99_09700 [Marmoricola sp.]|nr:hypothetical protein [Marmoricola sp.]
MPIDEELTPDELEQQQPVGPDEDEELEDGTTAPAPSDAEADEADVYEQSQTVPEDPEEERA